MAMPGENALIGLGADLEDSSGSTTRLASFRVAVHAHALFWSICRSVERDESG
jgi:hypothetical protein